MMEITTAYAIALAGLFLIRLFTSLRPYVTKILPLLAAVCLTFVNFLCRKQLLGPYTRAILNHSIQVDFALQLVYVSGNVLCICFQAASVKAAGMRAGTLALINLIPLAGSHLSLMADLLCMPLARYQTLHRAAGWMSFALLAFHVVAVMATGTAFPLTAPGNLFSVISASFLAILIILSLPPLRRPFYEAFLRTHQALSVLSAGCLWMHLAPKPFIPRVYLYLLAAMFLLSLTLQCVLVIHQNGLVRHGFPTATVIRKAIVLDKKIVGRADKVLHIEIRLSRGFKIGAGQYVVLWIRKATLWPSLQAHPFVVASWSEKEQDTLDIYAERRGGLTNELFKKVKELANPKEPENDRSLSSMAWVSGPHGIQISVTGYETVMLVAEGLGIVAQLPYLKQLIFGYNTCKTRVRRIHFVWQLRTPDLGSAFQDLLNNALADDTVENSYILQQSIYIEFGGEHEKPFGQRATAYQGIAPIESIFHHEAIGKNIKRLNGESKEPGEMLITVSGSKSLRSRLQDLAQDYSAGKVRLWETEYQPAEP